jgi:nucleoside-diphosphate-sugar epimerase
MMARHTVLVAGALGVVGRGVVEELSSDAAWDIIGASRRAPDYESRAAFVSVDLLDRDACERRLGALRDVTHVVYAAVNEQRDLVSGWRRTEHAEANFQMLRNLVDVVERSAPALRHITLLQGAKAYGAHLGSYPIPARETAPRHMPPNFYYEQEDFLAERQHGKSWSWTILRPPLIIGFAVGSSMNMLTTIAAYAAISKELGLPFRFPGSNLTNIAQAVDARLLARAIRWAGTTPACANQTFNVTNGDCYTWEPLWLHFARIFEIDYAPPQPYPLAQGMADKEPVWQRVVTKHGLRPYRLSDITSWPYADWQFSKPVNSYLSTIKARRYGFHDCLDTEEMYTDWLARLRRNRIVP